MSKRLIVSMVLPVFALMLALPVSAEDVIPDIPSIVSDLGQEANIITASLEQSSVKAGENISVSVKWFPIGDFKAASSEDKGKKPLLANLSITDGAGNFCADPVWRAVFSEDQDFTISAIANRDCDRLFARIALIGADAKLLDAVDSMANEKAPAQPAEEASQPVVIEQFGLLGNLSPMFRAAVIVVGVISLVGLVAILGRNILKRRSRSAIGVVMLPILLAITCSLIVTVTPVEAAIFSTHSVGGGAYNGGEQVNEANAISAGMSAAGGNGGVSGGAGMDRRESFYRFTSTNGAYFTLDGVNIGSTITIVHRHDWVGVARNICASNTEVFIGPTGRNGRAVSGIDDNNCSYVAGWSRSDRILRVEKEVVIGICGTANGGSFSTAPSSSLCVTGTESWTDSTAADNTFNWNCVGSGGGITTSCMANKTASATPSAACGSSNGGTFSSVPASNLCSIGTASAVYDYGYWSWTCAPQLCYTVLTPYNGYVTTCLVSGPSMTPVSCSANKSVSAPAPIVSLSASPTSVPSGGSSTLTLTTSNADACFITTGVPYSGVAWDQGGNGSNIGTSGTFVQSNITSNKTFQVSCQNSSYPSTVVRYANVSVMPAPAVTLRVNGSDGPLTLAQGANKTLSWTTTNATSCTAAGVDAFTGNKAVPTGSETLTVSRTSTDTLSCTGPGGNTSDSVQINATCTPSTGAWGACDCNTETKTRTNINASCLPWTESDACSVDEKNACRDFNWKEVAP